MNEKKYLPIGTVVMLAGGSKRAMITGFCPVAEGNKMYDYSGCLYPEGVLSSDQTLLFNHSQIVQIFFKGFVDQEQMDFMGKLNQIVSELDKPKAPVQPSAPQMPQVPAGVQPVQPQVQQPAPQVQGQVPMPQASIPPVQPPVQPIVQQVPPVQEPPVNPGQ